ncbi:unnamed protein product [Rangifer tarandus platyrhynchus]|uniref:Uncharacterized protein n=1 Tax=Rangifer tarandus platyrhynchus TaxID=3082113 RepID=A0ABN9A4Z1_RANTA|nr:unnamed protein product [Rangifer tarandus platyrhynchus]
MPSSPAAQGASVRAESPIVPPRDPPGEGAEPSRGRGTIPGGGGGAGRPGALCARGQALRRVGAWVLGGAWAERPGPERTHLAAAERVRRRAGERADSGNEAGRAGPRAVLFRSGRACPGRANPQALHTALGWRRSHRPGLMSRRRAAPRAGPRRLRSGDPLCAPPQRKQQLTVPGTSQRSWPLDEGGDTRDP